MAESSFFEKVRAKASGKNKLMKPLMDAIYYINQDRSCELVSEIGARQINHAVRLKYPGHVGYTVTPLIWAVMNGCHEVAETLLLHHAKVDRKGTKTQSLALCTTSPLLEAVTRMDCKMMKILLDGGASVQVGVPGPKLEEEEGGSLQYTTYLTPLNISLGMDLGIYSCLLDYADITLEYGPGRHTCLCFAVYHFFSCESPPSGTQYIEEVLHRGGKFCTGKGDDSTATGDGVCIYLMKIVQNIAPQEMITDGIEFSSDLEFLQFFQCLKLLCCTDNAHEHSQPYKACQTHVQKCTDYVAKACPGDDDEIAMDCVSWISRYCESPSSLKHICSVAIRSFVKPFSLLQCKKLGLPERLLRFIMLDDL